MFYFNSSPIPQDADFMQAQKVKEFREKIENLGAYHKSFESTKKFEKALRMDLTRYVKDTLIKENKEIETSKPIEKHQIIPEISECFKAHLNDLEANFAHSKVDQLNLEDIYIAPDLKYLNGGKKIKVENLDNVTDAIDVDGIKIALLGNDLSGKSTSCKYLYNKFFELGLYPVFINGSDIGENIRPESLQRLIETKISEQYEVSFKLSDIDKDRVIIIIDDFHKATKGKNRYWSIFMSNLESLFKHIIFTGNAMMPIENIGKKDAFEKFRLYSILEFGPKFRYEIVNKYIPSNQKTAKSSFFIQEAYQKYQELSQNEYNNSSIEDNIIEDTEEELEL